MPRVLKFNVWAVDAVVIADKVIVWETVCAPTVAVIVTPVVPPP